MHSAALSRKCKIIDYSCNGPNPDTTLGSRIATRCLLAILLILAQTWAHWNQKNYDFKLVYEWKQIEYKFASETERTEAIKNGTFNVGGIQPIDTQHTFNVNTGSERIFITTPRLGSGVPATLGVVTNETRDGNPILDPYPSWSWQINPEECNYHRLVSVFRVWVDECGRLWVMDNGILGTDFACSPQLLAFDLETDKLLYKYEIPYEQYLNVSWYLTPVAEVEDRKNACENTWLYVADPIGPALLVYSLEQNASWRIQDTSFQHDPNYTVFNISGDSAEMSDGILTVALSPASDGPDKRKLHYHALADIRESWVYIKYLKNQSNFGTPYGTPELFNTYEDKRDQQSALEAIDRKGNLYFSLLIDVELVKWDPDTPYKKENFQVIANDTETMQFPTGLKISPYREREALWAFATSFQKFYSGTLSPNETNFRLFVTEI